MRKACGWLCLMISISFLCVAAAWAAPMTPGQIKDREELFSAELQELSVVEPGEYVSLNGYVVPFTNRLVELGYLPDDRLRNGRRDDQRPIASKVFSAADFYAQVAGLPHTWGEIEPLTFVSLIHLTTECPLPMMSPAKYNHISKRYLEPGASVYTTVVVETAQADGNTRIYTGIDKKGEWHCTITQKLTEIMPEMREGDRVFAFGRLNEIDVQEKTASIAADLVAFQGE